MKGSSLCPQSLPWLKLLEAQGWRLRPLPFHPHPRLLSTPISMLLRGPWSDVPLGVDGPCRGHAYLQGYLWMHLMPCWGW